MAYVEKEPIYHCMFNENEIKLLLAMLATPQPQLDDLTNSALRDIYYTIKEAYDR